MVAANTFPDDPQHSPSSEDHFLKSPQETTAHTQRTPTLLHTTQSTYVHTETTNKRLENTTEA